LWCAFRQKVSRLFVGGVGVGALNCALSQTDQILILGIQSCLWFALLCVPRSSFLSVVSGFRVCPFQSFDVPSVRFGCFRFRVSLCLQFEVCLLPSLSFREVVNFHFLCGAYTHVCLFCSLLPFLSLFFSFHFLVTFLHFHFFSIFRCSLFFLAACAVLDCF